MNKNTRRNLYDLLLNREEIIKAQQKEIETLRKIKPSQRGLYVGYTPPMRTFTGDYNKSLEKRNMMLKSELKWCKAEIERIKKSYNPYPNPYYNTDYWLKIQELSSRNTPTKIEIDNIEYINLNDTYRVTKIHINPNYAELTKVLT